MAKLLQLLSTNKGQAALVGVLIIMAIILLLVMTLSYSSRQELIISSQETVNKQVAYLADSCLDEALIRLRRDTDYPGDTLNLFAGTCQISVAAQSERRTINLTAQQDNNVRKLEAVVKREEAEGQGGEPTIKLESWRELTN